MKTWRCTECSREWVSITDDSECLSCGFAGYVIHDDSDKNLTLQILEALKHHNNEEFYEN